MYEQAFSNSWPHVVFVKAAKSETQETGKSTGSGILTKYEMAAGFFPWSKMLPYDVSIMPSTQKSSKRILLFSIISILIMPTIFILVHRDNFHW